MEARRNCERMLKKEERRIREIATDEAGLYPRALVCYTVGH